MSINAAPTPPASLPNSELEVTVTIEKVKALDCPDEWFWGCGDADFYPVMNMTGTEVWGRETYKYKDDDNEIEPAWVMPPSGSRHLFHTAYPHSQSTDSKLGADVSISIFDADSGLRFEDDYLDISPGVLRSIIGRVEWDREFTHVEFVLKDPDYAGKTVFPLSPQTPIGFGTAEGNGLVFVGDEEGHRVEITLNIEVIPTGNSTLDDMPRLIGYHSPIHPDLEDTLTIRAGVTDKFGEPVAVEQIHIFVDPNPHDFSTEDVFELSSVNCQFGISSVASATSKHSCIGTFDLGTIDEEPSDLIGEDDQRMISYGFTIVDQLYAPLGQWSGWRSLTVGNRTGADVIGFSLAEGGELSHAVDIAYAGHSPHYGASGCKSKVLNLWHKAGYTQTWMPHDWPARIYDCEEPVNRAILLEAIEKNWSNTFASHREWERQGDEVFSCCDWTGKDGKGDGFNLSDLTVSPDLSKLVTLHSNNANPLGFSQPGDIAQITLDNCDKCYTEGRNKWSHRLSSHPSDYRIVDHGTKNVVPGLRVSKVVRTHWQKNVGDPSIEIEALPDFSKDVWPVDIIGPSMQSGSYIDILRLNNDHFNFWYTTAPARGISEGSGILSWFTDSCEPGGGCLEVWGQLPPQEIHYSPEGFPLAVTDLSNIETTIILNDSNVWRAAASWGHKSVSVKQDHYLTTLHEIGHKPFGLSDLYCCDSYYYQPYPNPNLYYRNSDDSELEEDQNVDKIYFIKPRPSCENDPLLGHPGLPHPAALQLGGCEPFESAHFWATGEYWRPEPVNSLMGHQYAMATVTPMGTPVVGSPKYRVQAGPQSANRIQWFIDRCVNNGDC